MNEAYNLLVNEKEKFLHFFKHRFPVFHNSNVFYRDIEYSVRYYLESRNVKLNTNTLIKVTGELIRYFETNSIFVYMSPKTWMINYPEFATAPPVVETEAGVTK